VLEEPRQPVSQAAAALPGLPGGRPVSPALSEAPSAADHPRAVRRDARTGLPATQDD